MPELEGACAACSVHEGPVSRPVPEEPVNLKVLRLTLRLSLMLPPFSSNRRPVSYYMQSKLDAEYKPRGYWHRGASALSSVGVTCSSRFEA